MTRRRRAIAVACAAAIAVVAPSALMPVASQAAAYRYWSYWLGTESGWSFANVGPAFRVPADGSLEGWRFSVSGVEGNVAPSFPADFEAVCGDTPAVEGSKRVAVIVDPGASSDAPEGEQPPGPWALCVVADEKATGYDVLRAAATLRTERGLICAIGGYPSRGCAEVIADPAPTQSATPTRSPKPAPSATPTRTSAVSAPASASAAAATSLPTETATRARETETDELTSSPKASVEPVPQSTAAPSPEPTFSMLTAPLEAPPGDGGGGLGGALVAGIAVAGIAGLGGAAILRMRRSS